MTVVPVKRQLAVRIFTPADQFAFAAWSGDRNPMHVDAVAARRLLSGRMVVHGVHTLLWALDLYCLGDADDNPVALRCDFAHPVSVGDEVVLEQADASDGRSVITASVDGLVCSEITLLRAAACAVRAVPVSDAQQSLGSLDVPLDAAPETQVGLQFNAGRSVPADVFPNAARRFGRERIGSLMALSYAVGMVCPGLHSVFSSLQLVVIDSADAGPLRFDVTRYDRRFGLFIVGFDGDVRGELRAFRRPPPQPQPSHEDVCARVDREEFAGTTQLVLGGSRGLGETTAKILAAGGASVVISHAMGAADAARVADEINAGGRGRCTTLRLDLAADTFEAALGPHVADLDAIYLFATPRIYRKRSALFDRAAFDEFVDFYAGRLHALCLWLEKTPTERRVTVCVPSTVFIAERPKGMTEYAMAKAAAEILADDLNKSLRRVRVVCKRLPRMATDQTASILQVTTEPAVDVLLAWLREMRA
jgi:NAD(P)-dependent dehydrogenase (short-subunit alcohol dehydrogenase family)